MWWWLVRAALAADLVCRWPGAPSGPPIAVVDVPDGYGVELAAFCPATVAGAPACAVPEGATPSPAWAATGVPDALGVAACKQGPAVPDAVGAWVPVSAGLRAGHVLRVRVTPPHDMIGCLAQGMTCLSRSGGVEALAAGQPHDAVVLLDGAEEELRVVLVRPGTIVGDRALGRSSAPTDPDVVITLAFPKP